MTMTTGVVRADDATQTRAAIAGFLAGYCGSTRRSYATDLRLFADWCGEANVPLFGVRRAHLELFGRWMEENGKMRSTVARRLSTLASFYRYCEQEGLIERNPATNVRRPKVDYESRTLGLDRNELGAFLVQAGLGSARDHALASLLALNGLRISEALGGDIDDLEYERGHRTLKILRKGGKRAVIPLAPRASRAVDLYIDERTTGPIFLGAKGERMDRYAADRMVKRLARRAGHHQAHRPTQPAPLLHHRGPGCGRAPARRARGRQPRRSPHHHALRPGSGIARPPRHLHRRHVPRRRLSLSPITGAGDAGRRYRPHSPVPVRLGRVSRAFRPAPPYCARPGRAGVSVLRRSF
jgi:integrase/recombinase XerD